VSLISHWIIQPACLRGDGEGDLSLIRDHPVHTPLSVTAKTILLDLEPLQASYAQARRVGDLGHVGDDGPLVGCVDGVSRVGGNSTIESMMPFSGELGTCRNGNDGLGNRGVVRIDAAVADDVVGCHVRDGLVEYVR
jgi:hypothetical protein